MLSRQTVHNTNLLCRTVSGIPPPHTHTMFSYLLQSAVWILTHSQYVVVDRVLNKCSGEQGSNPTPPPWSAMDAH